MGEILRPRPPHELLDPLAGAMFLPCHDLRDWAHDTFINESGPLYNEDHGHLLYASLGFLWTNVPCSRHERRVIGQTEFKPPAGTMGKWQKARAECQLRGWFPGGLDFLLTFDADYAAQATDAEFCALVEHELYHCGQAQDSEGAPKLNNDGVPIYCMRGHDVEEFLGVVMRYGAAGSLPIAALLEAARTGPVIDTEAIRRGCGTCHA